MSGITLKTTIEQTKHPYFVLAASGSNTNDSFTVVDRDGWNVVETCFSKIIADRMCKALNEAYRAGAKSEREAFDNGEYEKLVRQTKFDQETLSLVKASVKQLAGLLDI